MFSVDLAGAVRIVEARSRPKGWEDITVELLDAICEYLPQTNELLPMKGVSRHWNSVVNSVLERRALQQWTVWIPFTSTSTISPIPLLDISLIRPLDVPKRVDYEYYSSLFETVDVNPFPNKSLHLRLVPQIRNFSELGYNIDDGKPHRFLSSHGIHLTSLMLTMPEMAPLEFYRILQQTPNLRAFTLTLNGETRDLNADQLLENEEELPPSPCPSLAYLQLCGWSSPKNPVFEMLVKLFAAQLFCLEFDCIKALRFDCAFPTLQRLKIFYPPTLKFMRDGSDFCAPLQMLYLNCFGQVVSMAELLQFIHNFSDSLAHFCLRICDFKDDVEERMKSKICPVFLKVTKFAITMIRDEGVLNLIRTYFQPRFRNIKTLQLRDFPFRSERREDQEKDAMDFCRDAGFWCQFPKLKTIEMYTFEDRNASFVMTRD